MRRLPVIDALLLAALLPIWLLALGLHLRQVATGRLAHVGIYVVSDRAGTGYPIVSGLWPGGEATQSVVEVGDRLLSLGEHDLAGYGAAAFFSLAIAERSRALDVDRPNPNGILRVGRGDLVFDAPLPFAPAAFPWRTLPLTVGLVVTGTLLLIRRPGQGVTRAFFLAATTFAIHWTWFFGSTEAATYLWIAIYAVVSSLMFPMILITAAVFPTPAGGQGAWPRWPWIFALNGPVAVTASIGVPFPPGAGLPGVYASNIAMIITLLVVLTRNYRVANGIGRRQLKWVVYGLYAGLAPVLAADVVVLGYPTLWWLHDVAVSAEALIPICIFIAIVRYNLYDIDRLITTTIAYSVLVSALLAVVLLVVPPLAQTASTLLDIPDDVGQPVFTLAAALALVGTHRVLAPWIEQRLFRDRAAVRGGIDDMLSAIREAPSAEALLEVVTTRLGTIYAPEACTVETTRLTTEDSPRHTTPDTVVVPFGRVGSNAFELTLGPKRSGAAYSDTDLALLAAVANAATTQLTHLDELRRTARKPVLVPRRFEVRAELGRGGMGAVYRVRHDELGTELALKILHPDLMSNEDVVQRFRREARLMAALRHPNIVTVTDVVTDGDTHYIAMEYVAGTSLATLLRRDGALATDRLLAIALDVASALAHAHAHRPSVVHRDVKPANILIEQTTGRAVVTDFGIAKALGLDQTVHTRTGAAIGTLQYCAPEQFRGDEVDARVDVYGLGLVMYEMATARPYLADLDEARLVAWLLDPRDDIGVSGVPGPSLLRDVIARAIEPDRTQRYNTMTDLRTDIERLKRLVG